MEHLIPRISEFVSNSWTTYGHQSDQLEVLILQWANPSGDYLDSPLREYPLTSLRAIGLLVMTYLSSILILTVGIVSFFFK